MNFYGIINLSNPSRIFKTEAMEAVLWLIERVYLFLTQPVVNIFILCRLWHRTAVFPLRPNNDGKLENYIHFTWKGNKHEVDKCLLCADVEQEDLGPKTDQNKYLFKE